MSPVIDNAFQSKYSLRYNVREVGQMKPKFPRAFLVVKKVPLVD